ncbi:unnamed protein product [Cuscuta campestris]|uniref:Retrotransposon gag domain-containing protein n=1 Tax=Cuscuta campestris TaxID=132261 RepID=A0A484KVG6_9ASTE|nr:unnamed protein product [Cuscuta campestris]
MLTVGLGGIPKRVPQVWFWFVDPILQDFSKFSWQELRTWLYKVDQIFAMDEIPSEQNVKVAAIHLEGDGSIKEYQASFDKLMTTINLSLENAIRCFIEDLKPEINKVVRMQNPKTLMQAYKAARLEEEVFNAQAKSWELKAVGRQQGGILPTPGFKKQVTQHKSPSNKTVQNEGQALQNFGHFMSMFQQPGGFSPFNPGLYPQSSPQTNVIRPIVPTNLIGEMDKAGPSRSRRSQSRRSQTKVTSDGNVRSVHSKDEDWDVPQALKKLKGKDVQPEGSRRSAFQRLGHDGQNQNRSAKERLGVVTIPASAFNRAGRGAGRPGQTRRTEPPPRDEPQHSRTPREEEAESHPRHLTRSHVEQPRDRVGRVEARLEKLQRRVDREEKKKILLNESPFTDRVHETPFPKKAKLEVPKFTGKEDPEIHVKTLHQSGWMMGLSGDEKCLLFFQTLRGRAAEWFHNLPAGEIDSFDELAEVFQEKFKENCTKRKKFTYLSTAGQREHEDLTKFLTRWKDEVDKVEEMDDKTAMSLLVSGLRSGELYKEFCRRPPQSYQEAHNTAWDYADAEAQVSSKREAEQGHSKGKISLKKEIGLPGKVKAEIMEVKPVKTEKKPTGEKQWTEKYCSFHKTDSHNTAECNSVKGVIKQMIEAGEIDPEYLAQAKPKKNQWVRPEGQPAEQNKKKKAAGKEHLQVIYGGPEGGDSASQRKKWGRELYVGTVALNPRSKQARREPITFTDRDLPATGEDHNDPLVITMDMGGVDVSRVLVDTGSSVNILYLDAFEKLKLCRTRLEPLKTPMSGFTGDSVEAEGSILLTCELGTGDQVVQKQMRFVVVNIKCVHNAILGRPGINKVRGVISMAHLCMKFYTPGGIGQVRGDQKKARHCYLEVVKKMTKAFERITLVSQEEDRSKMEPGDETEQIVLREAFPERMVRIGRDLPGGLRDEIISVLREYADIFAWSVADMPVLPSCPLASPPESLHQVCALMKKPKWEEDDFLKSLVSHMNPGLASQVLALQSNDIQLSLRFFRWVCLHSTYCYDLDGKIEVLNLLLASESIQLVHKVLVLLINENCVSESDTLKLICALEGMRNAGFKLNYPCYSVLLMRLAKLSMGLSALQLYEEMVGNGFVLSLIDYTSLVNALCKIGYVRSAEMFCSRVLKLGFRLDVRVCTSLVLGYCRVCDIVGAYKVFDTMSRLDGCKANSVTYSILVHGLCKAGRTDDAFQLKEKMSKKGCKPSTHTYTVLIKAVCDRGLTNKAFLLLDEMLKKGCMPNVHTYTVLIDRLCGEGKFEEANGLFRKMIKNKLFPNVVTFNTLIDGYCKEGKVVSAFELLGVMERGKCKPNIRTYNELIGGLCIVNRPFKAMELLEKIIGNGLKPNEVTYNTLINGFCKASHLCAAFTVLQSMKLTGIELDGFTYTMLIDELCKNGKLKQATIFFGLMLKKGIAPDEVTLTALINGYCRADKIQDSFIIFDRMINDRLFTSPHAFNSFIDTLIKQFRLAEGYSVFAKMLKHGLVPSVVTYTILVSGLVHTGDMSSSLKVIDVMKQDGCQPNVCTYTAVMSGLCQSGRIKEAEDLLCKMPGYGVIPNDITYGILIKSHVKGGSLERALAIISTMIQNGCEPNAQIYLALLAQIVFSNTSGEQSEKPSTGLVSGSRIMGKDDLYFSADSVFREMNVCHAAHLQNMFKQCGDCTLGVYKFLILGLCKVGRVAEAKDLIQKMVNSGCPLDKALSSCIIEYFCRYHCYDYCLHLVKLMITDSCIPSFTSCSPLVFSLRNHGRVKEAMWLLSNLLKDSKIDDETAISSHIEFLIKGDEPLKCFDLLNLIHEKHPLERPII